MIWTNKTFCFLLFLFISGYCHGQVFLQLEKIGSTNRLKYQVGHQLQFKLKEHPDTWRVEYLEKIIPQDNAVVLGGDIYPLSQFLEFRVRRSEKLANFGQMIQQFGIAWSILGGLATISGVYEMSKIELIIGAVSIALGTLMRSISKWKKYKVTKNAYVRIIDLRMDLKLTTP